PSAPSHSICFFPLCPVFLLVLSSCFPFSVSPSCLLPVLTLSFVYTVLPLLLYLFSTRGPSPLLLFPTPSSSSVLLMVFFRGILSRVLLPFSRHSVLDLLCFVLIVLPLPPLSPHLRSYSYCRLRFPRPIHATSFHVRGSLFPLVFAPPATLPIPKASHSMPSLPSSRPRIFPISLSTFRLLVCVSFPPVPSPIVLRSPPLPTPFVPSLLPHLPRSHPRSNSRSPPPAFLCTVLVLAPPPRSVLVLVLSHPLLVISRASFLFRSHSRSFSSPFMEIAVEAQHGLIAQVIKDVMLSMIPRGALPGRAGAGAGSAPVGEAVDEAMDWVAGEWRHCFALSDGCFE
ncbi:hypothetical protein DFH09DRAFT_1411500, partial [Mycena vulgaris]